MNIQGIEYITGQDRNEPNAVAHLYRGSFDDPSNPMCARGWNRENGFGYSIFRNNASGELCKVCEKRAYKKLETISPKKRKTKWL